MSKARAMFPPQVLLVLELAGAFGAVLVPVGIALGEPLDQSPGILALTGVKGGLIVLLGCGEGKLTAARRRGPLPRVRFTRAFCGVLQQTTHFQHTQGRGCSAGDT